MPQLLHLFDVLLNEKSGGKGRNLNRVSVLALCALIYWNTRTVPEKFTAIETRLAKVEARLGLADTASTNAVPGAPRAPLTAGVRYSSN